MIRELMIIIDQTFGEMTTPRYSPIKAPGRIFSKVLTPFPISPSVSTDNYMI